MNIALVDNNREDLQKLAQILKEYLAIHRLDLEIACFSDAASFLEGYRPLRYTMVILDIYIDGMTGIDVAEKIRAVDGDVLLVFLTASEDHRAEAFRHYASAYLIKPCSETELFRTMDHLLHLHTEKDEKKFVFVCDRREVGLRHDNILSVQAERNYVMITEVSGGTWRTRMSFSEAQQLLSQDSRFLTIIRGVIVNLDHVEQISGGVCRLTDGTSFPVSSLRLKEIQQVWSNYHFVKQRRDSLWNTEEE